MITAITVTCVKCMYYSDYNVINNVPLIVSQHMYVTYCVTTYQTNCCSHGFNEIDDNPDKITIVAWWSQESKGGLKSRKVSQQSL